MMSAYKRTKSTSIIRTIDNLLIPNNPLLNEWRDYVAWCDAGNTPDLADADPTPTQEQIDRAEARADSKLQLLASKTPAQIKTFINANLTLTTQADKDFIASIAVAIGILYNNL